jgi:imidazolonepropionase-like amidohydrolase
MDLRDYARQRLDGVPSSERGPYTKAINAVHGLWPTVSAVRAATDEELMRGGRKLGPGGLAYLRELLGQ